MRIFNPRDYGAVPNDGKDDTKAIQAALDAAKAAGGGIVKLDAGTFTLTGTGTASDGALRIYSNTEISGAGMGQTILKLQDGWASKITGLIRTPVNEVTTDVIIRDLTLDGNRANTTADVDGIMTGVLPGKDAHDDRILIERVEIHDVSRIAFNPHEQTHNLTIRDSVAHHNSWDGFIADYVVNGVYENNVAYANDRHGFNVVTHSHDVVLRNNVSYDNAENGIVVQRGAGSQTIPGWKDMLNKDILVEGNKVYNNGTNGILFKQAENSQVLNNTIYGNKADGIQLEGANEIIVDGNRITSSGVNGIEVRPYTGSLGGPGNSYSNVITDNTITGTQKAFFEDGSTTLNNVYAGNVVGDLASKLGSTAKVVSSSSAYDYDKLVITATTPKNYTGGDTTTTPPPTEPDAILGTDSANTLNGTSKDDIIRGLGGADKLSGGEGNDKLYGGEGNDTLVGGLGKDTLEGGAGNDVFAFTMAEAAQGDVVTDFSVSLDKLDLSQIAKDFVGFTKANAFSAGYLKTVQNGSNLDVYVDQDGSSGSAQAKLVVTLNGVKSADFGIAQVVVPDVGLPKPTTTPVTDKPLTLNGTSASDTMAGGTANDVLKGGAGHDNISGNAGNDTLWGNEGNDVLYGGSGSDWMKGGDGSDRFIVDANLGGLDTIDDLRLTLGDKLEIRNILEFDRTTDAISDFIRMTTVGKDTIVSVDLNGKDGGSTFVDIAKLVGITGLTAAKMYDNGQLFVENKDTV